MTMDRYFDRQGNPRIPWGWRIWAAFCLLLGLGFLGFIVWAVITLLHILASK